MNNAAQTTWTDRMILESVRAHKAISPQAYNRALDLAGMGYIDTKGTWFLTSKGIYFLA